MPSKNQSLKKDDVKLEVIRLRNHENLTLRQISDITGIAKTTLTDFLARSTHKEFWEQIDEKGPVAGGSLEAPEERRALYSGKRYVFTSAQNNTYVNKKFLDSLLVYCKENRAELVVGTFTYNKNGFQNLQKEHGEWYDPKIKEYIKNESASLRDEIVWCGELNILPTAGDPLSGFETYTKSMSGIIPHAKVELRSCPVTKGSDPKFLYTTGCVTQANYIQKKAGQKAEFHHVYGALVVEFDKDGDWFARQLIASKNGTFYDFDKRYTPEGVEKGQRAEAITWGDLHSEKADEEVYKGSFGSRSSLLDLVQAKEQFCHDTLDFSTRNHHNINNSLFRYIREATDQDYVEEDIRKAGLTFKMLHRDFCKTICVESNHDEAINKWLENPGNRGDNLKNSLFYHRCKVRLLEEVQAKGAEAAKFSLFKWSVENIFPELDVEFLPRDVSHVTCECYGGIENAAHGDLGINGRFGGPAAYKKLNKRHNIGHSHSACITGGVYVAGVSGMLDMGYNRGPSTWSNSHILTYQNGKRAIVTMRGSKYRAK